MDKSNQKVCDIGEFGLLAQIRKQVAVPSSDVVLGIGDDAAAFKLPGDNLGLISSDLLVEGVHFDLGYTTPYQLGQKALVVNLSDIAAMGGVPRYALVSMALPKETTLEFVAEFYRGLKFLGEKYKTAIIGGDTSSSPAGIVISLSIWGEVEPKLLLSRQGARVGDKLLVTGWLGDAAAGLALLRDNQADTFPDLVERQLTPTPRCREGRIIAKGMWATSMIDISDGLASDVRQLAQESRLGVKIWLDRLPVSKAVVRAAKQLNHPAYDFAATGGEDYELLFTVPEDKVDCLIEAFTRQCDTPVSVIGCIEPVEQGVCFLDAKGQKVELASGYEHFTRTSSGLIIEKLDNER